MSISDKVQKDVKNALKFWLRSGTKNNNTSWDISLNQTDAIGLSKHASVLKKKFVKGGYPLGHTFAYGGSTCWEIWMKNNNTCRVPLVLHTLQVSWKSAKWFWKRSRKCMKMTPPLPFYIRKKFIKIHKNKIWA